MTISRVQYGTNNSGNTGFQTQIDVTTTNPPAQGNKLLLFVSYMTAYDNYVTGTGPVQTGVTWTRLNALKGSFTGMDDWSMEIWVGTVTSASASNLTRFYFTLPGGGTVYPYYINSTIVEYTSSSGTIIIDKTASYIKNTPGTTMQTGATDTTYNPTEVWVATISAVVRYINENIVWNSSNVGGYTGLGLNQQVMGTQVYEKAVTSTGQAGIAGTNNVSYTYSGGSSAEVLGIGFAIALTEPFSVISSITAIPSQAERGVSSSTLRADFKDSSDAVAGTFTVYFYAIGPSHTYGPFAGTVIKDGTWLYHATYSYQPGATDDLGVYSIKARLTKP